MSQSTIFRFRIDLSDIDRSQYQTIDFRLAQHPSESISFLLTRMFAYVLNIDSGLVFSPKGLGEPDEPCISSEDPRGGKELWIEIGNPSARRLHKASKAAKKVKVYTYKNPEPFLHECEKEKVHNLSQIEIFSLDPNFLAELEQALTRNNEWSILRDQESLTVNIGESSYNGELKSISTRRG